MNVTPHLSTCLGKRFERKLLLCKKKIFFIQTIQLTIGLERGWRQWVSHKGWGRGLLLSLCTFPAILSLVPSMDHASTVHATHTSLVEDTVPCSYHSCYQDCSKTLHLSIFMKHNIQTGIGEEKRNKHHTLESSCIFMIKLWFPFLSLCWITGILTLWNVS